MAASHLSLLLKLGVVLMIVATLDPMEGSIVIVTGIAMAAAAARAGRSPHRGALAAGFALAVFGVAALWGLSAMGGFGGDSGRSIWWGLTLLPYPIGWLIALVGGVRAWRDGLPAARRGVSAG